MILGRIPISVREELLVHGFGFEPTYLDRDLFLDFAFVQGEGEKEFETEIELEWALTRRLGLVVELPFIERYPSSGSTVSGFGDIAIAPRAMIYEGKRFIVSANLEVSLPTGSKSKGFGGEEVSLAPSVSTWFDLGHRTTMLTQFGYETGIESGDSEFFYSAAFTHSIFTRSGDTSNDLIHFPAGMLNFITEFTGRTGTNGPGEDESSAELLFGLSYLLDTNWEVRGAYQFPVIGNTEFEKAVIVGMIYHF